MSDTPETDEAWEYAWYEGGCSEERLLDVMRKLERERDQLRNLAGELIAIIRVNHRMGTLQDATETQIQEFLRPYIEKLNLKP